MPALFRVRRLQACARGCPVDAGEEISGMLSIPTIGIGAGPIATARCWWLTTCSVVRPVHAQIREAVRIR